MEHGRLLAATGESSGSWLAADAAEDDDTLYLYDVDAFDEDGGTVTVSDETNSDTVTYTGIDYDNAALTGCSGVDHDYVADDTNVLVYPEARERIAEVQLDDEDDTIRARVPHSLYDRIHPGFYDVGSSEAQSVVVDFDGQEWVVVDVLGKQPAIDGRLVEPNTVPTTYLFRYTSEGTAEGFEGKLLDGYEGEVLAVKAKFTGDEPTSDATVDVTLNGTSFQTLTISAGKHHSAKETVSQAFSETDYISVIQTSPEDGGGDLVVYVWVSLESS